MTAPRPEPAPNGPAPNVPASNVPAPNVPPNERPGTAAGVGETASAARWAGLLDQLGVPDSVVAAAPGSIGPGGVPSGGECAEALGQMFEYLDSELTDVAMSSRIGEHLHLCTACLAAYDAEKLVRAVLVRSCRADRAPVELRTRISVLIRAARPADFD